MTDPIATVREAQSELRDAAHEVRDPAPLWADRMEGIAKRLDAVVAEIERLAHAESVLRTAALSLADRLGIDDPTPGKIAAAVERLRADAERIERNRDMWKGQVERQAQEIAALRADAERWLYVRDRLCLTGNGDGTCSMHALNLPCSIPGWPEFMESDAFLDAAIDAARAKEAGNGN